MEYEIVPNQSAFPVDRHNQTWGLTKREYIATQALQGLLASPQKEGCPRDLIVSQAVDFANALIRELNKTEDNEG